MEREPSSSSCLGTRRRARPGRVTDYPAPGSRQKAKRKELGEREREPWEGEGELGGRMEKWALPERERKEGKSKHAGFPNRKRSASEI